jgi:hypothetical protein
VTLVERFADTYLACRAELPEPELIPVVLSRTCVSLLPVAGAGISMFSAADLPVPIGASDPEAEQAERLQFTANEGPCWEAHRRSSTVLATGTVMAGSWPDFHRRLVASTPFRSILAFPLLGELGGVGSVDLYCRGADEVARLEIDDVATIARMMTDELLADDVFAGQGGPRWLDGPTATGRNQVLIAMGMLSVAQGLTAEHALAELRQYATAIGETVDQVAAAVVARTVDVLDLEMSRVT